MLDSWHVHKAKSIQRSKDLLRVLRCEAMLESKEGGALSGSEILDKVYTSAKRRSFESNSPQEI